MKLAVNPSIDNYYCLLKNLNYRAKIELISKLSNSLLEPILSQQEQLLSCFGSFTSEQSADELLSFIRKSRRFRKKEIKL